MHWVRVCGNGSRALRQRNFKLARGALPGTGSDIERTAQHTHPFLDARQPQTAADFAKANDSALVETAAVILDSEANTVQVPLDRNHRGRRAGMLDEIIQGLLEDSVYHRRPLPWEHVI